MIALLTLIVVVGITLIGIIPEDGYLRGTDGTILNSPLIRGVVAMLFITASAMGIAYGITTGAFKNDADVMNGMASAMKTLATYFVLVFFVSSVCSIF